MAQTATFKNINAIITDIEGTTSSISFVKDTLFPYAANHMASFIMANTNNPDVAKQLDTISAEQSIARDDIEALIKQLLTWIEQDVKATPLKTIQGMIWKDGYEQGAYQAHMYEDATAVLKMWHAENLPLYVYSSGSVQAQKLFFKYSQDGDLLHLFSGHFDTQIGHKQEMLSYENIQAELALPAEQLLFLSDIETELDAAKLAGFQTCHLLRDKNADLSSSQHHAVSSFEHIEIR